MKNQVSNRRGESEGVIQREIGTSWFGPDLETGLFHDLSHRCSPCFGDFIFGVVFDIHVIDLAPRKDPGSRCITRFARSPFEQ